MSAAWLPSPVMFESSHDLDCDEAGYTPDQCEYYRHRWHNWYIADWVFALPTVAFFMCTIGIFIIGYALTQVLALSRTPGPSIWRRLVAVSRYLSYRGFRIRALGWNSAPVGVLLLGLIGTVYFFCMDLIPSPYYWPGTDTVWGNSPPLGTRSGWLALACMPFVFATASKTNWITLVTGVTHEKLQVFHRWISYAFFILALMHTFPFIVWHIQNHDMVDQVSMMNTFVYWTGIVALLFQAWLTFASSASIRTLGYEFFKATHFAAVILFMIVFFWHCGGTLTSWDYFVATAAVYVPCWTYPLLRTLFEYGVGQKAQIFVEDNGFTRITIPANFKWQPGQHCFLRFRSFGIHALSSHPFTICSLPSTSPENPSQIVFYIRHRGGFTARLYNYAIKQPGVQVPVFVDGPYGGIDDQKFYGSDRLVVVAGGSGAGWTLPFVEQFLRYHSLLTSMSAPPPPNMQETKQPPIKAAPPPQHQHSLPHGPRSLRVILATRDIATRTWFHTALNSLLADYKPLLTTTPNLSVEVHLTGDAERKVQPPAPGGAGKSDSDLERSGSSSASAEDGTSTTGKPFNKPFNDATPHAPEEEEVRGRPSLPLIIREEATSAATARQAVGVFMCGPLEMQHDARNAVAAENLRILKDPGQGGGGMYLHCEHFSWA